MKLNKKGFTLVEILVVIVLLGIIAIIVTPAVINGGDSAKKELLKHKIESIESSAVLYGQGNKDKFNTACNGNNEPCKDISNCYCYDDDITVGDLIDKNILNPDQDKEKDIINPLTKESLRDEKIVIYSKYGKIYAYLYNIKLLQETK